MYFVNPQLKIRPYPNFLGHQGMNWQKKASDFIEALVFGDSQTHGLNASIDKTWSQQSAPIIVCQIPDGV